jgi:hypothetical protein
MITETKARTPKAVLGLSLGEDLGFRNNNFTYRYVSNYQAYDKVSSNKD